MKDIHNKEILPYDLPIKSEYLRKSSSIKGSNKKIKRKRRKLKLWVLIVIFIFFLLIIILNVLKIIHWNLDNQDTKENVQLIDNISKVEELEDDANTEYINEPEEAESDYWYYIQFPLIQVNFDELIHKNSDTIAWIQVNNTNINYPIVQTTNNDYYLTHSYDKRDNEAGWVFMDYRNKSNFTNRNSIIYAHSRLDKTMFGSLSAVLKESWYKNKDNHIIKISTPTENTLWQIFSVYKIKEESYYITTDFANDEAYLEFLTTLQARSKYNFQTSLNSNDRILTLSTCYSDTERTVVHAKMIKKSVRTS